MEVSPATARRIEVLEIRLRIERAAFTAHKLVCQPTNPAQYPNEADGHIPYILGLVSAEQFEETFGVIRLARHAYRKSSDILHGRSGMIGAPRALMDEWIEMVEILESIVDKEPPNSTRQP